MNNYTLIPDNLVPNEIAKLIIDHIGTISELEALKAKISVMEIVTEGDKYINREYLEKLYGDRFYIKQGEEELEFCFDNIRAITVCGKNKLNFYVGEKAYQFIGGKRFNALKYVNFVFRYKNIKKKERGEEYDEFLGL